MEELIVDNEKFYCVRSDTNLADKQIDNIANMKVNQLYYPSISQIPVHITKLIVSGCCLQEISGVRFMKNLSYLDISNNFIKNISDLQYLQNLQYLNMTNNKIIFSQPLSALPMLQQLLLASNMIHDFDALATNPNFNINWICPQNVAQIRNFMDYLGPSSTIDQATMLMTQTISRRNQSPYYDQIILKYAPMVINKTLVIYNDQELRSIQFTDFMNIETLFVFECYNLSFERVPTKINKLAVNMCYIENINGLENMKSVVELSLRGNRISEIGILAKMNQLQKLDMAQNNLKSIQGVEQLLNLIEIDLSENYITEINSLKSMKQLKSVNLSKNQIQYAQDLEALTNLTTINISYNNLKNITFVKRMTKLVQFNASYNQINDIDAIKGFIELVDLRLDGNLIESFSAIDSLPNQKAGWYTSEQNVHESDKTRMIVKECLKFPVGTNLRFQDNADLKQFGFIDALKSQELTITNCPNISFENCPRIPIKLNINKCRLQSITGIFEMQQIVELDLGFNNIRHINELEALVNLQMLNLQNNDIYRINALGSLKQLKSVNLTYNKVIFSQPLNLIKGQLLLDNNLVTDNIALKNQQKPQLINYKNFLGPNSTENQINELAQINNYNLQMTQKYSMAVKNSELKIENDSVLTDFGFTSDIKATTLTILNCKNVKLPPKNVKYFKTSGGALVDYSEVKLNKVPSQLMALTVNNCELNELTGFELLVQLQKVELINNGFNNGKPIFSLVNVTSLTINNSKLTNVIGIEQMKQLTYLNLKDNQIVLIEPVKQLSNLKHLLLDNNFIHDLNTLTSHKNYTLEWIYYQNSPTDQNIQNYLFYFSDIIATSDLNDFKTALQLFKAQTDQFIQQLTQYENQLKSKYQNKIQNDILTINGDSNVKDFKFIDQLNIQQLIVNNCANLRFAHTPTKITSLTVNNTTITSIAGIEQMKQLQYVDLRDNCIISCEPLKHLVNLQMLFIDNNCIQDLEFITTLPNYKLDWIYYQRTPTASDIQNYQQLSNIGAEFAKHFELKLLKTKELIRTGEQSYDEKMVRKYQGSVSGNQLRIENDAELKDFKFVEKFNINFIYINKCPNLRFWRTPNNITTLSDVSECGLKNIRGLEKMKQLQTLAIRDNIIVDVSCIKELPNLTSLNLNRNKIVDFSPVQHLINRNQIHSGYREQKQPTQQEIEESKKKW
ncbi:Conserved_hypothetical protein [Hexamita inflata]|uniref:Uncharacterized protein n=1 Tax=Hexamita inflata TaxID=28002 RepID=A0AA86RAF9_9EUKA|nr:Conserved hypothetical protein [Hexamita inflata]